MASLLRLKSKESLGSTGSIEGSIQDTVVVVEALDVVLVVLLTVAAGNVALGPLAEASGDLLATLAWVLSVVAVIALVQLSSLTVWGWATVGEEVGVVEAALLLVTLEGVLHTLGGLLESLLEVVLSLPEAEPVVQELARELGQTGQTLERVSWWDLFVVGGGDGQNNGLREVHFSSFSQLLDCDLKPAPPSAIYTTKEDQVLAPPPRE